MEYLFFSYLYAMKKIRIGYGYDVHQLSEGREMWLGGVKIESTKGEVAHSDGDVLLHAICDSLLGALALGDIGTHFPDNCAEFKNIDSKILLRRCMALVKERGYEVNNLDCMVCLEQPKIKPHVEPMRQVIAEILGCQKEDVSIKATTKEQMGFIGRGEGVDAVAVVLLNYFFE